MISAMEDKAYSINLDIIREISERANQEGWTEHQRRGVLAQDSANISPGIEHDYVRTRLVGGDNSHGIGSLTSMYQAMAQKVRDLNKEELAVGDDGENHLTKNPSHNSIMDELRLAHEHLVFKWTSVDPKVKCSEIVAPINVESVTPVVIATITEQLRQIMPVYALGTIGGTSDVAGPN